MNEERDFKGVWIPKEVWLDNRLNALDKVILIEIDSLDNGERGCYASNKYIAEFCQCSERKVSESVSTLVKYGYIMVNSFDGRQRELRSRLAKSTRQTRNFCEADSQNLRQSNIDNNIVNNKDIRYIVEYLNEKAGTKYKVSSKATQKHIAARLKEGFTVDDFKTVIDKKCKDWGNDSKMSQYLRPETLFGSKFEGYLNSKTNIKKEGTKGWWENEDLKGMEWLNGTTV